MERNIQIFLKIFNSLKSQGFANLLLHLLITLEEKKIIIFTLGEEHPNISPNLQYLKILEWETYFTCLPELLCYTEIGYLKFV